MSTEQTRRTFLQLSALQLSAMGLTATVSEGSVASASNPRRSAGPAPSGEIAVWVTSDKLRHAKTAPIAWKAASGKAGAKKIVIDPGKKYQEILGFGAAFTDAACYMFQQLSADARAKLLHEFFHPSEMALSVCRTCMGSSDYSRELFSYDEGEPDPEMQRFSIEHDKTYVLPTLREARKENPDLFLFSSPWSPPGWMKTGGSMLGGTIRQRYFQPYAEYFLKFVQSYAAEGVPIQAVSVQNEVDTDQDGRMPACCWPQEYEIGFVSQHLGPLYEKNGITTKIWILDHNYNLWGRAICELDDTGLRKYCNSVAWHGYVGHADMMSKVHEAHPDAQMYWTEGGPDYTSPDYATDWAKWGLTFTAALRNWCQGITGWNLALDEKGRPNIGPFPCGGVVTINSQTKEITQSGQYWAFSHFSRAVKRGAKRIESSSGLKGIEQVAFENPDGKKVLLVTNPGAETKTALQAGGSVAEITLAANSLTTFAWS